MDREVLIRELQQNYSNYIEILTSNPDSYILCVPPNSVVVEKCEVDNKFIQEHILEMISDTEYRSLAGKNFKTFEHELHLVDQTGPRLFCSILSSDMFYSDTAPFRRYMVSNTLDPRFFEAIVNKFQQNEDEDSK